MHVFLSKFGSRGHNPGQFWNPCYIAVDNSDQVYVTDFTSGGGINLYSEDGHFIKKIYCENSCAICIAPDDRILTTVRCRDSLTVFSSTHEVIAEFGMLGEGKGQFHNILGIAINNSGIIFVAERDNKRLQIVAL